MLLGFVVLAQLPVYLAEKQVGGGILWIEVHRAFQAPGGVFGLLQLSKSAPEFKVGTRRIRASFCRVLKLSHGFFHPCLPEQKHPVMNSRIILGASLFSVLSYRLLEMPLCRLGSAQRFHRLPQGEMNPPGLRVMGQSRLQGRNGRFESIERIESSAMVVAGMLQLRIELTRMPEERLCEFILPKRRIRDSKRLDVGQRIGGQPDCRLEVGNRLANLTALEERSAGPEGFLGVRLSCCG